MSMNAKLVKIRDDLNLLLAKAKRATFKNLGHAGGYIRKVAQHSIRRRKSASAPGTPPSTQTGRLRRAVIYEVIGDHTVLIGPSANEIGTVAATHEHGLTEMPYGMKGKTEKDLLTAGTNWKLEVGGHGPIGDRYGTAYIKFKTPAQVDKSVDYIESAPPDNFGNTKRAREAAAKRQMRARLAGKHIKYPKRPFMGPALMNQKDRIPSLWADSVN